MSLDEHDIEEITQRVSENIGKGIDKYLNNQYAHKQTGMVLAKIGKNITELAMMQYLNNIDPSEIIATPAKLSDGSILILLNRKTMITGSQMLMVNSIAEGEYDFRTVVVNDDDYLSSTHGIPSTEQFNEIMRQLKTTEFFADSDFFVINLIFQQKAPKGIELIDLKTGQTYINGSENDPDVIGNIADATIVSKAPPQSMNGPIEAQTKVFFTGEPSEVPIPIPESDIPESF